MQEVDRKNSAKTILPWLVVGIGNPGAKYENTLHNIGWRTLDILRSRLNYPPLLKSDVPAVYAEAVLDDRRIILAWPLTYVNRSGVAVKFLMSYFGITAYRMVVVCDDVHLPPGRLRVRRKGGSGGHNGLKSIIEAAGDEKFARIRIGVGEPAAGMQMEDHVLSRPSSDIEETLEKTAERAAEAVEMLITAGASKAMNLFNS